MCKIMAEFSLKQQAQGCLEGAQDIALRMLEKGKYSIEEIAEFTKLSLAEIRSLANEKIAQLKYRNFNIRLQNTSLYAISLCRWIFYVNLGIILRIHNIRQKKKDRPQKL